MASVRMMVPSDLLKFNTCNLDPLTETYSMSFYLEYFRRWPELCLVIEGPTKRIEAYSTFSPRHHQLFLLASLYICDTLADSDAAVLGKIEASPYPPPRPYDPSDKYFRSPTSRGQNYLPPHVHITCLTVAPFARRQGHATLLSHWLERAGDKGDAWFVDLFVRKSNTAAVELYRKMGYEVWRTVRAYYGDGEDAWDMRKPLRRDKGRQTIRDKGEEAVVDPGDVW